MTKSIDMPTADFEFPTTQSSLMKNAPQVSVIGAILFFIVAHPFLFQIVDHLVEQVFGEKPQRDLLVFIHSVVFGLLMFLTIFIADRFNMVESA